VNLIGLIVRHNRHDLLAPQLSLVQPRIVLAPAPNDLRERGTGLTGLRTLRIAAPGAVKNMVPKLATHPTSSTQLRMQRRQCVGVRRSHRYSP
jgi:hypothetical protein